jgi:hypothetical protein
MSGMFARRAVSVGAVLVGVSIENVVAPSVVAIIDVHLIACFFDHLVADHQIVL